MGKMNNAGRDNFVSDHALYRPQHYLYSRIAAEQVSAAHEDRRKLTENPEMVTNLVTIASSRKR